MIISRAADAAADADADADAIDTRDYCGCDDDDDDDESMADLAFWIIIACTAGYSWSGSGFSEK